MAEFVKVMRDARRMCNSFEGCEGCALDFSDDSCGLSIVTNDNSCNDAKTKKAEEAIEQWTESHPEKTNLDILQKVFPKAKLNDDCCLVTVFGISKDCKECMKNICGDSCRERIDTFLNAPYEEPEEKK